ncbi:sulfotransferase family protein [Leptolyngbya sp. 7M]|uniref:sulfotransferase family protein n=1 Tax=Leptolyngbya sp. 7M TaxID=2812896 RepID=UPI001B8A9386|nr:sulfotransferase [Leptolyngbya sp. 7M]QYO63847.1 sulfotransferase [Leptolyngbya sp. 7M]
MSSVLIIVGMHRSGTSLTASLLQSAGVHIGEQLLAANSTNPKGHFENVDFFEFHQAVLRSQSLYPEGWTLQASIEVEPFYREQAQQLVERNQTCSIWGWKDPRTTLFLEFWAELLPEANFVMVYRSPWEVVDSLYRRGDLILQQQPNLAIKFWLHYNQKILSFYQQASNRCLLSNIETITQNQPAWIEAINQKFHIALTIPSQQQYEPSLLHACQHEIHRINLIDRHFPQAIELYEKLGTIAWRPADESIDRSWQQQLSQTGDAIWAFQDWLELANLRRQNQLLETELQQVKAKLAEANLL